MSAADTPAARLARLDAALLAHGQSATLRRRIGAGNAFVDVAIRARLTGYGTADLSSGVKVTDSKIIFSPTPILAASSTWPGAAGGGVDPKIGDLILVEGRTRRLEQIDNVRIGDGWVRCEGRVSG